MRNICYRTVYNGKIVNLVLPQISLKTEIVICVSRPEMHPFRPSLSFLAEAQPRLDNRRG
jgi:hypothetical protein